MLNVLIYMIENCSSAELTENLDNLETELERAGFNELEIAMTVSWLRGFDVIKESKGQDIVTSTATRQFSAEESYRLDLEAQACLLFLEQVGILDPLSREVVLDRLMALEVLTLDADDVKWVTMVTLYHQPKRKEALNWVQDFVFQAEVMH